MRPLLTLSLLALWACGSPSDPVDVPDPTVEGPSDPSDPTGPTVEPPTDSEREVQVVASTPGVVPPRVLTAVSRCVDGAWEVEAEVLGLPDADVTVASADGTATGSLEPLDFGSDAVFRRVFAAMSGLPCAVGDSASVVVEVLDEAGQVIDCLAVGPDAATLADSHAPCHAR